MNFDQSEKSRQWFERVSRFMDEYIYPAVPVYAQQMASIDRWTQIPAIFEELKAKARAARSLGYTLNLPLSKTKPWLPDVRKYWESFGDQIVGRQGLGLTVTPVMADALMEPLGKGFRETVRERLSHDGVIVIMFSFEFGAEFVESLARSHNEGADIIQDPG